MDLIPKQANKYYLLVLSQVLNLINSRINATSKKAGKNIATYLTVGMTLEEH